MDPDLLSCRTTTSRCWLCGSTVELTGEHKIKRKDIAREQKDYPLRWRSEGQPDKFIQGPNSNLLKFPQSLCKNCNSSRSQSIDRSYDCFRDELSERKLNDGELLTLDERSASLGTLRYFGKHLGCQVQYNRFPLPHRLSRFVIGASNKSCVSVTVGTAPFIFVPEDGSPLQNIDAISQLTAFSSGKRQLSKLNYQAAFMNAGYHFVVRMELTYVETLEARWLYFPRMKLGQISAESVEGRMLGLPPQE